MPDELHNLLSSTRWRPNTCGCELEFLDGPKQPPTHITRCPEHQEDDGLVVWDENRGLNRALSLLEKAQGVAPDTVMWTFTRASSSGRRSLEIVVPGDVGDVQTQLDPGDQRYVRLRSVPVGPTAPRGLSPGGQPEVVS